MLYSFDTRKITREGLPLPLTETVEATLSMIVGYQRFSLADRNRTRVYIYIYIYARLKARISHSSPPSNTRINIIFIQLTFEACRRRDTKRLLSFRDSWGAGEGRKIGKGRGRRPIDSPRIEKKSRWWVSPDGNKITSLLALERRAFPSFFLAWPRAPCNFRN